MRLGLLTLGVASLFGLSAWSSRSNPRPADTLTGEAPTAVQAVGSRATTLEPILIEATVPAAAGVALNSSANRRRTTSPVSVSPKPATAEAIRSNALGYDFGL